MISAEKIQGLIQEKLEEKDFFLVDLVVKEGNNINMEIDSLKGVTIKDCIDFSRQVEHNLDRDEEDFELHVSSPGLDKPLRVEQQYEKNIGRKVKVITLEGKVVKGVLKSRNTDHVVLEYSYKERMEGRKKKETIIKEEIIPIKDIKETTVIISFK